MFERLMKQGVYALVRKGSPALTIRSGKAASLARRKLFLDEERIDVILDVGANAGQYALETRALGYTNRIVSFEPLTAAYTSLEREAAHDENWQAVNLALGDAAGSVEINIAGNSYSSSILPMLEEHERADPTSRYTDKETIRVERLDSIADEYLSSPDRAFMKIDTQGYEAKVLDGAVATLRRIRGVQLEMSLTPMYEGELLMSELVELMNAHGFQLHSLEAGFSDLGTGQVYQVDGIFRRDG